MTRTSPPAQLAQAPAGGECARFRVNERWRLGHRGPQEHRNCIWRDGEWLSSGGEVEAGWTWPLQLLILINDRMK